MGDLILDQYISGSATRLSPEAPVPVVSVSGHENRLGGAGNLVRNIAAMGVSAHLIALVGNDDNADILRQLLDQEKISHSLHPLKGATSIIKRRILCSHQQLLRMDEEQIFPDASELLAQECADQIATADLLVLSDYAKGTLVNVSELLEIAAKANVSVFIDPKGEDFAKYRGAALLSPNQAELEAVVGRCDDTAELVQRGEALRQELAIEALLITRGEHGMSLLTDDEPFHLPAYTRAIYDVTGAGDTVMAVLAAAMVSGYTLTEAMMFANVAAGIVVGRLGAAVAYPHEVNQYHSSDKVISATADLRYYLESLRTQGRKIVLTNGCFDILHAGHVRYLQQARALGDCLIVAVNDDHSVRRLKGADRPIIPLQQRMQVLAALECVDWLLPFSADTPAQLVEQISPDILVKGGDYAPADIAGAEHVYAHNGEVQVLPLLPQCSTSDIIARIQNSMVANSDNDED